MRVVKYLLCGLATAWLIEALWLVYMLLTHYFKDIPLTEEELEQLRSDDAEYQASRKTKFESVKGTPEEGTQALETVDQAKDAESIKENKENSKE